MAVDAGSRRPAALARRYRRADLDVFTGVEQRHFRDLIERARRGPLPAALAWELLYRREPGLYDRWASAEQLHPRILEWLPARPRRVLEVGAGSGRMTAELARRGAEVVAVEPAAAMRRLLQQRLRGVRVRAGFLHRLPVPTGWADLVVTCSTLTPDPFHGGDRGLLEMERACASGGMVVVVWPNHVDWLRSRGYQHVSFPGRMALQFDSLEDAVSLARVFYPQAVATIRARGSARVPYSVLGYNPPRDLAFKLVP